MDVGPSAAPMMPMLAASVMEKPSKDAKLMVKKMPNWAAAPNSSIFGLDSNGPKSIIAPIPMNNNSGNSSFAMPESNRILSTPSSIPCVTAPDKGRLTSIAPKPMGNNKAGSMSFLIARKMRIPPIAHMTTCCQLMFRTFPNSASIVTSSKDFTLMVFSE